MDPNFPRLFTVNEANGLLPIIRPLVDHILDNIRRLKGVSETVIRREQLDPDAPSLMEKLREDGEVLRLVTQIKDWVSEINGHGCVCKGVEQGLIDFPCMLGSEVVFLCWQIGEASVAHYHRVDDGFAGRKTLLEDVDAEPDSKPSYH